MRLRFIAVLAVLAASAGLFTSITSASAAGGTCFGRAATVVPDGHNYYLTAGDDVVVGTSGVDFVTNVDAPGVAGGTDFICTGGGADNILMQGAIHVTIDAGSGADIVSPQGSGTIDLDLGPGNDFVNSAFLVGTVRGGTGNDVLFFQGYDIIPGSIVYGDSGNDFIQSASAEFIYAGSGKDTVIDQSDTGATLVDCGSGRDTFYAPVAVTVKSCDRDY